MGIYLRFDFIDEHGWTGQYSTKKEEKMQIPATTSSLIKTLIKKQFPEFSHLEIQPVDIQGHDNRTYRLGNDMLVRIPTSESYALKVPKEQEWLPKLKDHLSIPISSPIKMGIPSQDYPLPFSIYAWIEGKSINTITMDDSNQESLAQDLGLFLKELQSIDISGDCINDLSPGLHNWWRGDHVSVYDEQAREQIKKLGDVIDPDLALPLWEKAIGTTWSKSPVWIHGDMAVGNILVKNKKLSGIIDFGSMGVGDPACDLVIAWTYLKSTSREIFKQTLGLDEDTWLRAKGWALWKATYELYHIKDLKNPNALKQKDIIHDLLYDSPTTIIH